MQKHTTETIRKRNRNAQPIVFFIDIDGTLTDGSEREKIMEERGFVIGQYGDPERTYPKGKQQFLEAFCDPELFHTDLTMESAHEMMDAIKSVQAGRRKIYIFFVTARDSKHHHETEQDLRQRGLWVGDARLVCKPHRETPKTVEYKTLAFASIVACIDPSRIIIIDNSAHILKGAQKCFTGSAYGTMLNSFENCTDALNWWKSYVKHQLGYES